eukprot:TRINITY_DN68872_c0_g2_i1.p1 TRINITY_DN68872_c0_g2~~TRINITY_DN68872_c0_g2_i1.p1  ORF type:complete len:276 (-),score=98.42 TRINITY_DN68872_c0_g2_i1:48-875(-)
MRSTKKSTLGSSIRTSSTSTASGAPSRLEIDYEEVKEAFEFFDSAGKGVIRPKDLKEKLEVFYPNLTIKDYKFLIDDPNFTLDKLYELLSTNDLGHFDPVREAFKVYDPRDTGYVDPDMLRGIMSGLGHGVITEEDMNVLIKTADVDGDGRINLSDFREMLRVNREREKATGAEADLRRRSLAMMSSGSLRSSSPGAEKRRGEGVGKDQTKGESSKDRKDGKDDGSKDAKREDGRKSENEDEDEDGDDGFADGDGDGDDDKESDEDGGSDEGVEL